MEASELVMTTCQELHALLPQHEVRRDEEELPFRGIDDLAKLGSEMRLRLGGGCEHLVGMIRHDRGAAPGIRDRVLLELPGELAVPHAFRIGRILRRRVERGERSLLRRELLGSRILSRKSRNWNRSLMIPVKVEFILRWADA